MGGILTHPGIALVRVSLDASAQHEIDLAGGRRAPSS